jgi:hypothetical protein
MALIRSPSAFGCKRNFESATLSLVLLRPAGKSALGKWARVNLVSSGVRVGCALGALQVRSLLTRPLGLPNSSCRPYG